MKNRNEFIDNGNSMLLVETICRFIICCFFFSMSLSLSFFFHSISAQSSNIYSIAIHFENSSTKRMWFVQRLFRGHFGVFVSYNNNQTEWHQTNTTTTNKAVLIVMSHDYNCYIHQTICCCSTRNEALIMNGTFDSTYEIKSPHFLFVCFVHCINTKKKNLYKYYKWMKLRCSFIYTVFFCCTKMYNCDNLFVSLTWI